MAAGSSAGSGAGALAGGEVIEACDAADDAVAKKADQQHEDDTQHELPRCTEAENGLEEILQGKPDGGADQRSEQRSAAADRGLHHELSRGIEGKRIRRHERLQDAEQAAREAGIGRGDHERGQFVTVYVVADRTRTQRIVPNGVEDGANR